MADEENLYPLFVMNERRPKMSFCASLED